ncbi:polysaccharide pyruvyl transferase family protein [Vagococcus carniphilus]|uniref:polysaccharide pyruvyl transferase family protein n=1 Tax=Vagococcus carniphilus TaxID=218144 RepID=UPI00288EDE6C|nr:polysaccharide pyruvyl transferase family protein [Vagococcus carniphilus]MDT2813650.1 polysaccharide pyruvyl transferase family protein [Vagococcus carniphilus]
MKSILITFCDSQNLGDLLIVESLEKMIEKKSELSTLSFDLKDKDMKHQEKLRIKNDSEISIVKSLYLKYLRKFILFDLFHFIKYKINIKKYNWNNLEKKLRDTDLLIIGGGNTIFGTTHFMSSTDKILEIVKFAKSKGVKVFICSAGIGPFKSKRQLKKLREILIYVDYVTVRDRNSLNYVKELNSKSFLTLDPVISFELFKDTYTTKYIGISIMDIRLNKMSQNQYKEYIKNMTYLIKCLSIELPDYKFKLFSTDINDYQAVYEVFKQIKDINAEVVEVENINDLQKLYETLEIVIGARMHSLILAFSQYIPIIGFSWQPKVDGFFEMINQRDSVFNLLTLDLNFEKIIDLVLFKINNLEECIEKNIDEHGTIEKMNAINQEIIEEVFYE